jgi:hypothetical protein
MKRSAPHAKFTIHLSQFSGNAGLRWKENGRNVAFLTRLRLFRPLHIYPPKVSRRARRDDYQSRR